MSRTLAILMITEALVILTTMALAQTVVSGIVADPADLPVSGASVEAVPIRSGGFAGSLMWIKADTDGHFRLTVEPGKYEIRGKAEAEGYPDSDSLLAHDPEASFPTITVGKDEVRGVVVRLGRRGGILEGDITNANTGNPVPNAKVRISDIAKPEAFVEVFADKSGYFSWTVPPKTVAVSATAPGYKTRSGPEVMLSGGEHQKILIDLEPEREP